MTQKSENKQIPLLFRFVLQLLGLLWLAGLPFILLLRVSVWVHVHYQPYAWLSILAGAMAMSLVLWGYFLFLHQQFVKKIIRPKAMQRNYAVLFVLVLAYCGNSVWSISTYNVKEEALKVEFRKLHPVLRLGIGTLILLEKELLLTDAERQPEDYQQMGLASKRYSLHYEQSSGYVHAVDIRTKGHSWLRNSLIQGYFKLMGFNTLLHRGTAPHLHVSLPCRGLKGV